MTLPALFSVITIATVVVVTRTLVSGNVDPHARPCYDYLCRCAGDEADCSYQGNKLTFIPRLMSWVDNIEVFLFSFNYLPVIHDKTFENISSRFHVSYLRLRSNKIKNISTHAFHKLTRLSTLDLSDNPVILHELRKTFNNMPKYFAYVYLEGLGIRDSDLEDSLLGGLKKTQMTGIHLARNQLSAFNYSLFTGFSTLTTLSLEHNRISGDKVDVSKSYSASLSTLWLDHNNITTFPEFCLNGKKTTPSFPSLYTLSIEYNKISALLVFNSLCLSHLGHLFLSGNQINIILPHTFAKLYNLQLLNISMNTVDLSIKEMAFSAPSLRVVNLTNSSVRYINPDAFRGNCSLTVLDLSDNNFSSREERLLPLLGYCLKTLKELTCNRCNLTKVPSVILHLPRLNKLFLNYNNIQTIQDNMFDKNHHLQWLYLGSNEIQTLDQNVISNSVRSALTNASLEDNPFICSCDILWLRNWLVRARPLFSERLYHYECWKPDNTTTRIIDDLSITNGACLDDTRNFSKALCAVFTVLVCVMCFALGYKWRWYIRYCWKWRRGKQAISEELHPLISNDAYILYCDDDFQWVRHQALPNLEEKGHLKLCFRHRDFSPKDHVVDSIVYHLRHSRKVLFVLSNSFFKDSGSVFELSLVKKRLEELQESLVVVLLEDIDNRYMSQDLYQLMRGGDHVRWTGVNDNPQLVWRNLLCQFRGTSNRLV